VLVSGYSGAVSWIFQGPTPYTMCVRNDVATTNIVEPTWNGEAQIPTNLPRYDLQYYSTVALPTPSNSSTSDSSSDEASGWVASHHAIIYGVVAGVAALLALAACHRRRRARVAQVAPATRYSSVPRPGGPEEYATDQQQYQSSGPPPSGGYPMYHQQYQYDPAPPSAKFPPDLQKMSASSDRPVVDEKSSEGHVHSFVNT
jgi:hypothetical protein